MPTIPTLRPIPHLSLPITGWFAGASLALVQCALGAVAPIPTGRAMVAIAAVGLLAGLVELAALAAARTVQARLLTLGWAAPTAAAATLTTFIAPFLGWLTSQALSGRRVAALPFRSTLLVVATSSALMLVFLVTRFLAARASRFGARPPEARAHVLAIAGCLVASALLIVADNRVLVRRYEWFHLTLELGAFLSLQMALLLTLAKGLFPGHADSRRRPSVTLPVLVASFALLAGWRCSERLWDDDQEGARAQLFSADGVVASALEFLRPSHGFAAPLGPRSSTSPAATSIAPPPTPETAAFRGADVILVTIDALRADHLGFAGYPRPTSPNLDALAARSTVFERAYTPSPHTSFALASVLTGRHSFSLARAGLLEGAQTLPDVFKADGYRTVGLFPPAVFFVERERFGALEARRYGFESTRFESLDELLDAPARTNQAIEALDGAGKKPLFMWIHYFGPHEPYLHHPELAGSPIFGPRAVDRYDEEIRHVDQELGRLVHHLDRRTRPYVLVVTADHGEEFGEHGGAYHGTSLFDEQIRVPLVIRVPEGRGRRVRLPASTVDIAATLSSLVGLAWRAPEDSIDRAPVVLGDRPAADLDSPPALAELESMKALMAAEQKLVCDTARDYCRLFDLAKDPAERRDVAPAFPGVVEGMRGRLEAWLRRAPDLEPNRPVAALLWAAQRWDASAISRLGQVLDAPVGDDSPTSSERRAAVKIMARAPRDEHRLALSRAFRGDPDVVLRNWAAIALAGLGDATAVAAVAQMRALRLGDPELDSRAALALAGAAHDEAGQALVDILPGEKDVNLRCQLVSALAVSGHPEATRVLLDAYPHIRSRICVAKALAKSRDDAALSFLIARVRDEPYTTVRAAVARALGAWRTKAATSALQEVFRSDPDEDVVAAAAKGLAAFGTALRTAKGRALRVPPAARELWVVTKPAPDRALRIWAGGRTRLALKAAIDVGVGRDAYSLTLPPGQLDFIQISAPATHALFR